MRVGDRVEDVSRLDHKDYFRRGEDDGQRFIKMDLFLEGTTTYQAVNLSTGWPAFPVGMDPEPLVVVDMPPALIPAKGSIRYETAEMRNVAFQQLEASFPGVVFTKDDGPGTFWTRYVTTADVKSAIKSRFGGE